MMSSFRLLSFGPDEVGKTVLNQFLVRPLFLRLPLLQRASEATPSIQQGARGKDIPIGIKQVGPTDFAFVFEVGSGQSIATQSADASSTSSWLFTF